MAVLPELEAFLELVEFGRLTGKGRAMHEQTPEQARADFELASLALDQPLEHIACTSLGIQARDGRTLAARLYRAPGLAGEAQPTLLYFHGGGYVVGSLDSHDALCRRLAAHGLFALLAVDYRLAPEWRFPTPVEDACDAAIWLHRVGAILGLDPTRVAFAGDSVGASLAAVLSIIAARQPHELPLAPKAQVLVYPVTDATRKRPSHRDFAEGYLLETATLDWFYAHYGRTPEDLADWRCSPLLAPDLSGLAPALVYLAGHDPLHDEGLAYAQKLESAGNEVKLLSQPGLTHDFLRMAGLLAEVEGIHREVAEWVAGKLLG
ncbi:alpha/beta hydrolase [Metapseudomonas lalkuanensis]|uniref:Alpha/beta hydrolase n=1 Tax=Metapseudomonas lalkuanensis TaxID=2604832 RepID=A0A5J6QJU2_9GAMM|nr:alpha/beta hydrolase [Pseudomonas lalkuanensis]QEY62657.1 alpha/beta hydrolase [Pseudomonas lalkuanensis]UCO96116.1 alpha/beta hydrolase [Pseudomonas lalkuanensis]